MMLVCLLLMMGRVQVAKRRTGEVGWRATLAEDAAAVD
jgi:hypothetical protein